jgi:hypothetical protein
MTAHVHVLYSNESFGWHFQFLTIIGLALATITFMFGLLADLSLSPRLFLVKNILSMTSAPLEVLVTLLYWLLRAVCLTLVPRALRKVGHSLFTLQLSDVHSHQIDRNLVLSDFMELNLIAGALQDISQRFSQADGQSRYRISCDAHRSLGSGPFAAVPTMDHNHSSCNRYQRSLSYRILVLG